MMSQPNHTHWMKCHANRITSESLKNRLLGLAVIVALMMVEPAVLMS